ncbi:hypothetical protein BJ944DRAFT_171219 [Cunninghamella echinulata]|nr:hypothetical protein BJ944DRAFT_171219 [Cunninghamella echinulata]
MANLDIKIKLANTIATALLLGSPFGPFSTLIFNWKGSLHAISELVYILLELLLLGLTIYQWLPSAPKDVLDGIGYWYLLIALLNFGVETFLGYDFHIIAYIGLLWQLATAAFIYHRLRNFPPRNKTDQAFINAPFSILLALLFANLFYRFFKLFDQTRDNDIVHTIIIIAIGFVALHLVDYSHRKDWIYASTTAWILGFNASLISGTSHTVSLVVVGILISAVARTLIPNWLESINRRFGRWSRKLFARGERTPLLS